MRLERLTVRDYRNLESETLEFGPRFTVLVGENGAGKTNVLEALYLLSTLRSFRTSELGALIRHGGSGALVELTAYDPNVGASTRLSVRLERRGNGTRKTAAADGKVVRAAADFYGRIRAVLFTPEDLAVLRGPPAGRRQFLDRTVFARERAHIRDVQAYEKLVRSRNHVLRQDPPHPNHDELLASYEEGLAKHGAALWQRRVDVLAALSDPFASVFAHIHGGGRATIRYQAKIGTDSADDREGLLREQLLRRRHDDKLRGSTSVGPHRDEVIVELDGQTAALFASQGQARALVLAFKLAELGSARALVGSAPVLLLDDVSSELDPKRSAQLFEALLEGTGQCVLTTTARRFVALPPEADLRLVSVREGVLEVFGSGSESEPIPTAEEQSNSGADPIS